MSFWASEVGTITGNESEAFAKSFVLIPDGTKAVARICRMQNTEYNGSKSITVEWELIEGDFKGRSVTQRLKVFDKDSNARYRALNMLKLLYDKFGLKPVHSNAPTDNDFKVFINKKAGILIRETEPNENGKQYNWVSEVHSEQGFKSETGVKLVVEHVNNASVTVKNDDAFSRYNESVANNSKLDDDIPF